MELLSTKRNQQVLWQIIWFSVNKLPDGTAISAMEDMSRVFEKLRKEAQMLSLPNPNSISLEISNIIF